MHGRHISLTNCLKQAQRCAVENSSAVRSMVLPPGADGRQRQQQQARQTAATAGSKRGERGRRRGTRTGPKAAEGTAKPARQRKGGPREGKGRKASGETRRGLYCLYESEHGVKAALCQSTACCSDFHCSLPQLLPWPADPLA